jgi:predicted transcriptional regulator
MNWSNVIKLIPTVVGAVNTVETIVTNRKGSEKQDAAVNILKTMLPAQDIHFDVSLFLNPEFQTLLRNLIDSIVAMMNFMATERK